MLKVKYTIGFALLVMSIFIIGFGSVGAVSSQEMLERAYMQKEAERKKDCAKVGIHTQKCWDGDVEKCDRLQELSASITNEYGHTPEVACHPEYSSREHFLAQRAEQM